MAFLGIPTSRKDLGKAGWIKGAATVGARLAGNTAAVLNNKGAADRYRGFADAIDDPNKGYSGTLNPLSLARAAATPTNPNGGSGVVGFSVAAPSAGKVDASSGPQVNGAMIDETGLYGAGGGAAVDPNTDPARLDKVRGEIKGLMDLFSQAFESAMSRVDALAGDKRGELNKKYASEKETLSNNYGDTSNQIDNQMAARGAFNSSYRANEQGTAKNAFDTAFEGLNTAQQGDEAKIGQFVNEQKATLNSSKPNYDLGDYNQVDDLQTIKQNVDQAVKALGVTSAGLGTTSQYRKSLDSIAPQTADTGNTNLRAQLDRLAGTNANPEAKRFIAAQTISDAGEDPATWMDYFEQQNRLTGSTAPASGQALTVA